MRRQFAATAVAALALAGAGIGIAEAAPDNPNNDHGICTAYFNGQKNGHEQGNGPGPFGALEDANDDDIQSIFDFCNSVVGNGQGNGDGNGNGSHGDGIGGNPDENGRFTDCFTDANNDPSDDCTDGDPA